MWVYPCLLYVGLTCIWLYAYFTRITLHDHDNIGVNIICPLDKLASYVIRREDVINVLCAMKCTKLQKHWIIYVGESSAVLIKAIFDRHLWNEIWTKLQETFDCENPVPNKGIVEMRKELFP